MQWQYTSCLSSTVENAYRAARVTSRQHCYTWPDFHDEPVNIDFAWLANERGQRHRVYPRPGRTKEFKNKEWTTLCIAYARRRPLMIGMDPYTLELTFVMR